MGEESFAEWLKEQRRNADLTLRELAEKLNVKHPYLSQLENDLAMPGEDLARRIAQVFHADEEHVVFLAREVGKQIREINEKFPNQAPTYFRRVVREEK